MAETAGNSGMWYLLCHQDKTFFELNERIIFVGKEGCDINLEIDGIDQQHAALAFDKHNSVYKVKDFSTTHGTFINSNRISVDSYVRLNAGDLLNFGNMERIYEIAHLTLDELEALKENCNVNFETPKSQHSNDPPAKAVMSPSLEYPQLKETIFSEDEKSPLGTEDVPHIALIQATELRLSGGSSRSSSVGKQNDTENECAEVGALDEPDSVTSLSGATCQQLISPRTATSTTSTSQRPYSLDLPRSLNSPRPGDKPVMSVESRTFTKHLDSNLQPETLALNQIQSPLISHTVVNSSAPDATNNVKLSTTSKPSESYLISLHDDTRSLPKSTHQTATERKHSITTLQDQREDVTNSPPFVLSDRVPLHIRENLQKRELEKRQKLKERRERRHTTNVDKSLLSSRPVPIFNAPLRRDASVVRKAPPASCNNSNIETQSTTSNPRASKPSSTDVSSNYSNQRRTTTHAPSNTDSRSKSTLSSAAKSKPAPKTSTASVNSKAQSYNRNSTQPAARKIKKASSVTSSDVDDRSIGSQGRHTPTSGRQQLTKPLASETRKRSTLPTNNVQGKLPTSSGQNSSSSSLHSRSKDAPTKSTQPNAPVLVDRRKQKKPPPPSKGTANKKHSVTPQLPVSKASPPSKNGMEDTAHPYKDVKNYLFEKMYLNQVTLVESTVPLEEPTNDAKANIMPPEVNGQEKVLEEDVISEAGTYTIECEQSHFDERASPDRDLLLHEATGLNDTISPDEEFGSDSMLNETSQLTPRQEKRLGKTSDLDVKTTSSPVSNTTPSTRSSTGGVNDDIYSSKWLPDYSTQHTVTTPNSSRVSSEAVYGSARTLSGSYLLSNSKEHVGPSVRGVPSVSNNKSSHHRQADLDKQYASKVSKSEAVSLHSSSLDTSVLLQDTETLLQDMERRMHLDDQQRRQWAANVRQTNAGMSDTAYFKLNTSHQQLAQQMSGGIPFADEHLSDTDTDTYDGGKVNEGCVDVVGSPYWVDGNANRSFVADVVTTPSRYSITNNYAAHHQQSRTTGVAREGSHRQADSISLCEPLMMQTSKSGANNTVAAYNSQQVASNKNVNPSRSDNKRISLPGPIVPNDPTTSVQQQQQQQQLHQRRGSSSSPQSQQGPNASNKPVKVNRTFHLRRRQATSTRILPANVPLSTATPTVQPESGVSEAAFNRGEFGRHSLKARSSADNSGANLADEIDSNTLIRNSASRRDEHEAMVRPLAGAKNTYQHTTPSRNYSTSSTDIKAGVGKVGIPSTSTTVTAPNNSHHDERIAKVSSEISRNLECLTKREDDFMIHSKTTGVSTIPESAMMNSHQHTASQGQLCNYQRPSFDKLRSSAATSAFSPLPSPSSLSLMSVDQSLLPTPLPLTSQGIQSSQTYAYPSNVTASNESSTETSSATPKNTESAYRSRSVAQFSEAINSNGLLLTGAKSYGQVKAQTYDSLLVYSILQMSNKLVRCSNDIVGKLRPECGSPGDERDAFNGEDVIQQELYQTLRNMKNVEYNLQTIDRTIFPQHKSGRNSTLGSCSEIEYLQERDRIQQEMQGFRPIVEAPSVSSHQASSSQQQQQLLLNYHHVRQQQHAQDLSTSGEQDGHADRGVIRRSHNSSKSSSNNGPNASSSALPDASPSVTVRSSGALYSQPRPTTMYTSNYAARHAPFS